MFAPPEELDAETFARIPDHFRRPEMRPAWRPHETVDCFLEGPCFDKHGNLHVVDIPYGRIFRIDPHGDVTLAFEYDGWPNGLKIRGDGRFIIADHKLGLLEGDPETGVVKVLLGSLGPRPFKGLNDLTISAAGDIYFTDQGTSGLQDPTGRLVCLRASGEVEVLLDNIPSPNGLVLNQSEKILYLAVTRANNIWRVPLSEPGQPVVRVGVFVQLSGSATGGPDGLAMDGNDNLAIAHVGLGSVWVFNWLGEPIYRIRSKVGIRTTNLAFGPNGRDLFVTESSSGIILKATLPVPTI